MYLYNKNEVLFGLNDITVHRYFRINIINNKITILIRKSI